MSGPLAVVSYRSFDYHQVSNCSTLTVVSCHDSIYQRHADEAVFIHQHSYIHERGCTLI